MKGEKMKGKNLMQQACACTMATKPCTPNCPCKNEYSSAGCLCCATYGSITQQFESANRIVRILSGEVVLKWIKVGIGHYIAESCFGTYSVWIRKLPKVAWLVDCKTWDIKSSKEGKQICLNDYRENLKKC